MLRTRRKVEFPVRLLPMPESETDGKEEAELELSLSSKPLTLLSLATAARRVLFHRRVYVDVRRAVMSLWSVLVQWQMQRRNVGQSLGSCDGSAAILVSDDLVANSRLSRS